MPRLINPDRSEPPLQGGRGLREQILKEHTKANCETIVQWIGNNQKRFDELFHLFITDEYRVVQRSAWPLSYAAINHPGLIKKHFGKLLSNLNKPNLHDAIKRNTVRLLQQVEIPKKYHGKVMDICFNYIANANEAIAIKAFSLTVLQNLSKQYPAIIPEIKLLVEENYDRSAAAFKSRAKKFLLSL